MENEVKEPAPKYNYISPEEYLEMERSSDEKHEYYDGYVQVMGGASLRHNHIAGNLYARIGNFLLGKDCQLLPSDMRVSTPNRDAFIYPDASIVCGQEQLEDNKFDTLINPVAVFEILSAYTHRNDAGYKLLYYQNIPSIKEYIMIDSRKRYVQSVHKQPDGAWRINDLMDPAGSLFIQTINFSLSFDDIYRHTGL